MCSVGVYSPAACNLLLELLHQFLSGEGDVTCHLGYIHRIQYHLCCLLRVSFMFAINAHAVQHFQSTIHVMHGECGISAVYSFSGSFTTYII